MRVLLTVAFVLTYSVNVILASDFIDNANGAVIDKKTGLIWQQDEGGRKKWEDALTYCESMTLSGKNDWRLPNSIELQSLVDYTRSYPAIDITYFPSVHSNSYWSSTTYPGNTDIAWLVYFGNGEVGGEDKSLNFYVRCVRGGQ